MIELGSRDIVRSEKRSQIELNLIFNAIADELPDITRIGDMRRVRSGWLNGVKDLPVRYSS